MNAIVTAVTSSKPTITVAPTPNQKNRRCEFRPGKESAAGSLIAAEEGAIVLRPGTGGGERGRAFLRWSAWGRAMLIVRQFLSRTLGNSQVGDVYQPLTPRAFRRLPGDFL